MDYNKFCTKISKRREPGLIRQMAAALWARPNATSFAAGFPNPETFPFESISIKYKNGSNINLQNSDLIATLQYGPTEGYLPLVKKWRQLQKNWHSPKYNDWNVQFCAGAMEACSKIFELLVEEGDPVMVQSPTYTGVLNTLLPMLPDFIPINTDEDGALTDEIISVYEKRIRDSQPLPKVLYVNPTGANPLGLVYSNKRKEEIYKLAQKYDFLIIEDDPYYFLYFTEERPNSFLSIDVDGRVLRVDSFSKIMGAGLRLGSITAPTELIEKLNMHIGSSTVHASSCSQMLVYRFLESLTEDGMTVYFKNIQNFYQNKRDIMLQAIDKYLTGIAEWYVPKGGMFIWLKITALNDVYDFVMKELISQNILVMPGHAFYPDRTQPCQYVRLSYGQANHKEVDEAFSKISKAIKKKMIKY